MEFEQTSPMSLESYIGAQSSRRLFIILCSMFLVFYVVQIQWRTTFTDVYAYSLRSLSPAPIMEDTYVSKNGSGNIHVVHTLILWLVYRLVPEGLSKTIWPSGLVSAVSGFFVVGLTFLIWSRLGLEKSRAFVIACIVGWIPSIWYNNIIGEEYSLQLCFILLFLYLFLIEKSALATIGYLFAMLVSPTSGFYFPILLLAPRSKANLIRALVIGFATLVLYLSIAFLFKINLFSISRGFLLEQRGSKGLLLRMATLFLIILVNVNFLIFALVKGGRIGWERYRGHMVGLIPGAILPQIFFLFLGSGPFSQLGHQQLPLLWVLGFPIGLAVSAERWFRPSVTLPMAGAFIVTLAFWMILSYQIATDRDKAGYWLKAQPFGDISIIGNYEGGLEATLIKYDWSIDQAAARFINISHPSAKTLIETGQRFLVIVETKRLHPSIRSLLTVFSPRFGQEGWKPSFNRNEGLLSPLYENESVALYRWDAPFSEEKR